MGKEASIRKQRETQVMEDMILFGALFVMSLYYFVLYVQRPINIAHLYFSICASLAAFRILTTGLHLPMHLFPNINWTFYIKMQYLCTYLSVPAWILLIKYIFPRYFKKIYLHAGLYSILLMSALVILTPVKIFSYSILPFQLLIVLLGLYVMYVFIKALKDNTKGSGIFLMGWSLLFIAIVNDVLNNLGIVFTGMLTPIGFVLFVFFQAVLLSQRLSESFTVAEELSDKLERRVISRTQELQDSNMKLEQAREIAEEAKLQADSANRMFLANMSHELRTPMNVILGASELLQEEHGTSARQEYLDLLMGAGDAMLVQINDILDISKIESGQLTLEKDDFDLKDVVKKVCNLMSERASKKKLVLSCHVEKDVPAFLIGDASRLQQVLINLISNAIKFTHAGEVLVEIECESKQADLTLVTFSVIDTGIGISPDKQNAIFDTFTQADPSTTRQFGGTGLGLSISKEIVELMGGRIWVDSEEGKGSRFHFTVSFKKGTGINVKSLDKIISDTSGQEGAEQAHPKATPLRILLVEDNPTNQLLMKAFLKKESHSLQVVENGEIAVNMFRSNTYDLVLMDMQMPVMDGYQATKEIRSYEKEEGKKPVRIIALTANVAKEDIQKSIDVGCNDHVTKPIKKARLLSILRIAE